MNDHNDRDNDHQTGFNRPNVVKQMLGSNHYNMLIFVPLKIKATIRGISRMVLL